jgi:hypothetical protein
VELMTVLVEVAMGQPVEAVSSPEQVVVES